VTLTPVLAEAVHNAPIPPPSTWTPLLLTMRPTIALVTGTGIRSRAGAERAWRITSRNTFCTMFFIPRTAGCYVGDAGYVFCFDPGHQVFDFPDTLWRKIQAKLPDCLRDCGQVCCVDKVYGDLLVIANIAADVADSLCSQNY